jgi:hypothetical protein
LLAAPKKDKEAVKKVRAKINELQVKFKSLKNRRKETLLRLRKKFRISVEGD